MTYDLAVASLTYSLVSPDTVLNLGDQFSFSYRIFNGGTEPATGSAAAVAILSSDLAFSPDDVILFTYTYTYTTFPSFFGHNVTVLLPSGFAPGRYNLIFQIDSQNQIAESNEINNSRFVADIVVNRADLTTNTSAALFAEHGKLAFMARLAAAAYHLTDGETEVDGINHANPDIEPHFAAISADLTLLDSRDLPGLARTDLQGIDFPVSGLRNGIYTNQNAAALLARSADAVFLAFRGTNDNNGEMGVPFSPSPETPDGDHWVGKDDHFALFAPMLAALVSYMQNYGLTRLYVTGHSLGASMVQAYMDANAAITVLADTFASPGYGVGFGTDARVNNLWIDGDPITTAAFWTANVGDQNKIFHDLRDQITELDLRKINFLGFEVQQSNREKLGLLHSVTYYAAFTEALQTAGIGEAELSGRALHGIDYDRVYVNASVNGLGNVIVVGGLADSITASTSDDIVLGMVGNDTLHGSGGRDHIVGGANSDSLYGGIHADYLYGGTGADQLFGGEGRDVLTGGANADRFVFLHSDYYGTPGLPAAPHSLSDTILDFQTGVDRIDLGNIDTSLVAGDQRFVFRDQRGFTGTAAELRFAFSLDGNTLVRGDIDGNGSIDFTITLIGLVTLQASDFIL